VRLLNSLETKGNIAILNMFQPMKETCIEGFSLHFGDICELDTFGKVAQLQELVWSFLKSFPWHHCFWVVCGMT
jgi:hypothetical protein